MIMVSCKICRKSFKAKPWHLQQGWSKCCSKKCRDEALKKGKFVNCDTCRKRIWRTPKKVKRSKSGKFFCKKSCQTIWRNKVYSGSNHALWIGGSSSGFYRRKFLKSGVPIICKLCNEKDIRVLQVHHKDSNRKNNELNNLVWVCLNCHHLIHNHGVSPS